MSFKQSSNDVKSKKNIFINYRVHDTAGETGRLVDRLKQHFSEDQIFMDIDKIEPGVDFTKAISKSLESCDIMLAVIGPNWLGTDSSGNTSRIKNPNDWVKTEISTALQRDIRVVPVLVDGGQLPSPDDLPADLQPLLLRQSYEISNKRWDYDTEQLINVLIKSGITPKPVLPQVPVAASKSWWRKNSWWVYILIGVIITFAILLNVADENEKPISYPNNDESTQQTQPQKNESQQNLVNGSPQENAAAGNVDGTWIENDAGVIYTYDILQTGNTLSIEVYVGNQFISSGSGYINGDNVELSLNINGINTIGKGRLSRDRKSISGTYTVQATGQTGLFTLARQF